jgi:hypothetical protein
MRKKRIRSSRAFTSIKIKARLASSLSHRFFCLVMYVYVHARTKKSRLLESAYTIFNLYHLIVGYLTLKG